LSPNKSILFFCSFPPPFTGQRIATKLIFDLLNDHAHIDVINLSADQGTIKRANPFKLSFTYIQKYLLLIKKLRARKYDYVYVVFAPSKPALLKDFISAYLIKKYNKGLLITHLHCGNYGDNFRQGLSKYLFNRLLKKVNTFIFLSPVLNKLGNLAGNKVFYLDNTISGEVICTDDEVNRKILKKQNRQVLEIYFISNMIKQKGYEDLAIAAGILNARTEINFRMHFIGAWPDNNVERKNFEEFLKKQGVQDKVIIYGAVNDRQKIKEHFLNADIFVLPTYYAIEAQPLSIIEAFNAATPVISTLHASIPDMVDDKLNGYLVHIQSPAEIADSIIKLQQISTWSQMALRAREKYLNRYTNEILLNRLLMFFRLTPSN